MRQTLATTDYTRQALINQGIHYENTLHEIGKNLANARSGLAVGIAGLWWRGRFSRIIRGFICGHHHASRRVDP